MLPVTTNEQTFFSDGEVLRFANYYTNHMVLQMAPAQANVWGFSPNVGDDVTIRIDDTEVATVKSVARSDGESGGTWSTLLPPKHTLGPSTLTAMSNNVTASLIDVLFGDVWVCSGQSNMQFQVKQVNYTSVVSIFCCCNALYPGIFKHCSFPLARAFQASITRPI